MSHAVCWRRLLSIAGAVLAIVPGVMALLLPEATSARQGAVAAAPARSATIARPKPADVSRALQDLRLINYFPRDHSWRGMWTVWDPTTLSDDFSRISALNGNAVRITVFPDTFGYPHPSALMKARLSELVNLANAKGLKVQLSIFDQFRDWSDVRGSRIWARSLLMPYRNDPRIAFVDVRNELDPSQRRQVAWARRMVPYVQKVIGTVPVTVSKSGGGAPAALLRLKKALAPIRPDFWDWHYYGVEGLAYGFFKRAAAIASPRPLFIGEAGMATWPSKNGVNGVPVSVAAYEQYQAYYFRVLATAAQRLGLPPIAPWMLWDLDSAGAPPQPSPSEYHFGLVRTDGTPKAAAKVVADYFAGSGVSQDVNYSLRAAVPDGAGGQFPTLWRLNGFDGQVAWDPSVVHDGDGSVRMSQTAGTSGSAPQIWAVPVDPHVAAGGTVCATVWARGSEATGSSRLAIGFFDNAGVYCGQAESPSLVPGTGEWCQLTAVGRAPRGANYIRIYLKSSDNTGCVWFADAVYEAPTGQ